MDTLAKEILNLLPQPLPSQIYGEPWRIQLEGEKIIKDQQARLYENVHKGKALWYWTKKRKIKNMYNDEIGCNALEKAKKKADIHQ
jgi:hypothetical protein